VFFEGFFLCSTSNPSLILYDILTPPLIIIQLFLGLFISLIAKVCVSGREKYGIEEYSFSQSTLEQVGRANLHLFLESFPLILFII
jgi:hypothetical protein